MRPESIQSPPSTGLFAWVLGPKIPAERIGLGLEAEGFEVCFPEKIDSQALPRIHETDAVEKLKTLLERLLFEARKQRGEITPYLHPGLSPWANRHELLLLCQELGITVLAPSARSMNRLSNRLGFLHDANEIRIPHLVLSFDPLSSPREVERIAKRFPRFVLKSVKENPTGMGILPILEKNQLKTDLPLWMDLLRSQVGEAIVFAESYLEQARQIRLPFARFADGSIHFFQNVDGSLQSMRRKIVELSPSPAVDPEMEGILYAHAKAILEKTGFVGVGSLEFLLDGDRAFLIEGHPRLSRSFRAWEKTSGTSIVSWQLATLGLRTKPLQPEKSRKFPTSLTLSILAEDPFLQLPQPGFVAEIGEDQKWKILGAEAEMNLAVEVGDTVSIDSDGWIGEIWIGAQSSAQAFQFADKVLERTWIAGDLHTNERFLRELVTHPWVKEGIFHAGFVDEEFLPKITYPESFLTFFEFLADSWNHPKDSKSSWLAGEQRVKPVKRELKWRRGPSHSIQPGGGSASISGEWEDLHGVSHRVFATPAGEDRFQVRIDDWCIPLRRFRPGASKQLRALVTGRVRTLHFREGAHVPAHEPVLLIESLGRMVSLALPVPVTIRRWLVTLGDRVRVGQVLAELEHNQE